MMRNDSEKLEPDKTAILFDGGHPFTTIRASAGSGKTYRLSTRYLYLLRRGDEVGSILATTFTRKAAGEVLGRVIAWLADASVDTAKREELSKALRGVPLTELECRAMLRRIAGSLHRLSISTIDGFFNRIAQSFSYELDLPIKPVLLDEKHPTATQLRLDAIEAMLADEDLPGLVTLLRQLHHDSSARSVTQAIDNAVTGVYEVYREAPQRHLWSLLKPLKLLDEDGLRNATQALTETAGSLPAHKSWQKAFEANRDAALDRDWERFVSVGLAKKLCAGEDTFYNKPIAEPFVSAFEPLIGHAAGMLIRRVAEQTRASFDLMERFDKHYTDLRRKQGVLLFSDLTHKLAYELPEVGDGLLEDIYFRLDAQVMHLLLDEFQDTSLAQWRVLSPFAHEITATSDVSRSFLCVGDTKQAIYGWRGGVAELFDKIEDELSLGEESKQYLSVSYRSSSVVLDAVNEVFEGIKDNAALQEHAQTAERWGKGYQTHEAFKNFPGYVTLETSRTGDNPDAPGAENSEQSTIGGAHERYTAQRIKALADRPGGAGSIGVLVSTNAAAAKLIHELDLLGVNTSGEGGSRVSNSPAVQAVLSALVLADHPGDTASAFHVVNSPLGKVVGLSSMDPDEIRHISLSIRSLLLSKGYAQTIADWTTQIADDCDWVGLNRLTQLIDLAERAEPVDVLRPCRFVALAESARVADPSQAAVRVMTIHGAKGLEFDTVVLAELDRLLTDKAVVLVTRDQPTGPITGVYRNADKQIRALDEQLQEAAAQQRSIRLMDDLCALYVAMTRAKQALHLIVKPLKQTKSGGAPKLSLSFASIFRSSLSDAEETFEGGQVLYERGDRDWLCVGDKPQAAKEEADTPTALEVKLTKSADASRRSWPTISPSSKTGGERSAADLLDLASHDATAMGYGTLIHAWLECVGFIDEDDAPHEEELTRMAERLLPDVDPAWVSARLKWFAQLLASPLAKELLSRGGADELWRERGFAVHDDGKMLRGVFDRVTVTRDSTGNVVSAVVLDYKTDKVEPGQEQAVTETYRGQMLAYRSALIKLLKIDPSVVQLKLWFLGSERVVDILDS